MTKNNQVLTLSDQGSLIIKLSYFMLIFVCAASSLSCTKDDKDFTDFFLHTVDDKFSLQIPRYLEEQDYEISNITLEYRDDLLSRVNYQQQGTNEKFKKGLPILPIVNTFDINLISGTSETFSINTINYLNDDQLKRREASLLKMLKIQAEYRQKNVPIEKLSVLEVKQTNNNNHYFTQTFKVDKSILTLVIIPLHNHMLNISYSCEENNCEDFEKSIKSIIVNEDL